MSGEPLQTIEESCSYCGRENTDHLPTCSGCGSPLTTAAPDAKSEPSQKSVALGICLAIFFGPLGLLYANIFAGLIMLTIAIATYFLTRGGVGVAIGLRIVCAVWAYTLLRDELGVSDPQDESLELLNEAARLENSDIPQAIVKYEEVIRLYPKTRASKEAVRNIVTLKRQLPKSQVRYEIFGIGKSVVVIIIFAAAGILFYFAHWVYVGLRGYRGVAANTEVLADVYHAADPDLASFYTDSYVRRIPFVEPIAWNRQVWRPSVTLTNRVDAAQFQKAMAGESFSFIFSHPPGNTYSFKTLFLLQDSSVVVTYGSIDMSSGAFEMRSSGSERKVDSSEWYHMTNGQIVGFGMTTDGVAITNRTPTTKEWKKTNELR
jgi:hypothetical protein